MEVRRGTASVEKVMEGNKCKMEVSEVDSGVSIWFTVQPGVL